MTKFSPNITKPEKTGHDSCYRCGGDGIYSQFHGQCFRCGGSGIDPSYKVWVFPADWTEDQVAEFHEEREAKNAKARQRRHEKKLAERDAQMAKNLEAHPDLAPIVERVQTDGWFQDGFVDDIVRKAYQYDLTDAQAGAAIRAVEQMDAREAAEEARLASTPPVEEGTFEVTGEIVSVKWRDNQWGGQLKQLIELDNGQRLWGTKPTSLQDAEVGDRVSFTATVSPSTDDHTFGFYSRPRKGQIL